MVASDLVCLRPGPSGGLTVPVQSLRLLWSLEARGFTLTQDGGTLIVRPPEQLTPTDCEQIRRWKFHLLSLLAYIPPRCA